MNEQEPIGIGTVLIGQDANRVREYTINGESSRSWIIGDYKPIKIDKRTLEHRYSGNYSPIRFYTRQQWAEQQRHGKAWSKLTDATHFQHRSKYTIDQLEQALAALGIDINE